jgi:hypothetical protein
MSKFFALISLMFVMSSCGDSLFSESQVRKMPRGLEGIEGELEFLQSNLSLEIIWRKGPLVLEESNLIVVLKANDELKSLEKFNLKAKLWMPSMGHGSYPIMVKNLGNGVFDLSEVFFSMEGNWDFQFELYHQDLFLEQIKWPIEI